MNMLRDFRRVLTGTILEPGFWATKRLPVFKYYKQFRLSQWDSPEMFKLRQKRALSDLLEHAVQNIPFYKKFYSEKNLKEIKKDPFRALRFCPILEKKDVNTRQDELSVEMGRGTFQNSTGGSTGIPTTFLQDNIYQAATLGATALFFEWAGSPPGSPLVKLWGAQRDIGTHGTKAIRFWLSNFLSNRIILNCYTISPEKIASFVETINRFHPWVLEGYTDVLFEISRFMQKRGLAIDHSLKGTVTSATVLLPHMRSLIEETFQAPVFNRYGSREAGNMAAECPEHSGLHVMGETTILEVVDENGMPVSNGKEGDILVTNLWNYTMPLIRYRIGDRAILSSRSCPCGRPYPLIEELTGRSSSVFYLRDGGIVKPTFFIDFIRLLHNDTMISKFQIVQKDYDQLVVRLLPKKGFDIHEWPKRHALIEDIKKLMGNECHIKFSIENDIEKTPTGKHLYTVSEINK